MPSIEYLLSDYEINKKSGDIRRFQKALQDIRDLYSQEIKREASPEVIDELIRKSRNMLYIKSILIELKEAYFKKP